MSNEEILSLLLKIKEKATDFKNDGTYDTWCFEPSYFKLVEKDIEILKNIGSLSLEIDSKLENLIKVSMLLTNDIGWYRSSDEYFKILRGNIRNNKIINYSFFIEGLSSSDIEEIKFSSKAYVQWCDIFSKISDHVEYDNSNMWPSYIFVMEGGKTKKITKYKIPLKCLENDFLKAVKISPCDISTLTNVDLHSYERKLVLRTSLIELYNEFENENKNLLLINILKSPNILWDLFYINYEIYINKYSINKVIHEIEIQKLDFLSKLNSLVQEHQTKSLSIPAVLVSTAIIKGWSLSGLLLIFIAMLLTCFVVILGISNAKKSLFDIMESSSKTMTYFAKENSDIDDLKLTTKINKITKDAIFKLENKKTDAEKTLNKLEFMIFSSVAVWSLFVLFQFKDIIRSFILTFFS
ncbi:hypothetical protein M5X66_12710 [Providencia sp. PROV188]|uniref:hypothetical protein n=1 Tax=Providencia sp. PROV188 TaxID=2939731 RepID=UPI0022DD0E13|nr:hypothetical protein [Providencia sp. PROV188]WBM59850.1 hypothetical protein M5X66_12710 [Providencia sp. PROV188]